MLDKKVLNDNFSEFTVDIDIIPLQDSRFWFDLMKAVCNLDVEHTTLKYENFYKTGQQHTSGRKALIIFTST